MVNYELERKIAIAKLPELIRARVLALIAQYFRADDPFDRFMTILDIQWYVMRLWERGYINSTDCVAMLDCVEF